MSWTTARSTLRTCLGDGETDHYEFKAEVTPSPDGLHTAFFLGRPRLVPLTVSAVLNGADYTPAALDYPTGTLSAVPAPSGTLLASYYYQWFTDPDLDGFLLDACNTLGYTDVSDDGIPLGLRSCILDFAMSKAFTRKAAEAADGVDASSPDGYSLSVTKTTPNWQRLADEANKRAVAKLDLFVKSPLLGGRPSIATTTYRMPVYTPQ